MFDIVLYLFMNINNEMVLTCACGLGDDSRGHSVLGHRTRSNGPLLNKDKDLIMHLWQTKFVVVVFIIQIKIALLTSASG